MSYEGFTTCGICFAVIWRENFDRHIDWHDANPETRGYLA